MKLKHKQHKRARFFNSSGEYYSVTTYHENGYMWSNSLKKWCSSKELCNKEGKLKDIHNMGASSHFAPCKSVRAFRRRLKQWSKYLPKDVEFILVSKYIGVEVRGSTKTIKI